METKRLAVIRRTLAEHGVSQQKFAKMVGVSHPYLSDILNGHRAGKPTQPKIDAALEIIKVGNGTSAAPAAPVKPRPAHYHPNHNHLHSHSRSDDDEE